MPASRTNTHKPQVFFYTFHLHLCRTDFYWHLKMLAIETAHRCLSDFIHLEIINDFVALGELNSVRRNYCWSKWHKRCYTKFADSQMKSVSVALPDALEAQGCDSVIITSVCTLDVDIQICNFPLTLPEHINLLQFFPHVSAFHYLYFFLVLLQLLRTYFNFAFALCLRRAWNGENIDFDSTRKSKEEYF